VGSVAVPPHLPCCSDLNDDEEDGRSLTDPLKVSQIHEMINQQVFCSARYRHVGEGPW
jgi:hypothetical protein